MDESMPVAEFADPGPVRDRLVSLILIGTKTGTSSLLEDYETQKQPLPRPGECQTLVDSRGQAVATIEIVEVRTARLAEVDWTHVLAEGEGHRSMAQWRQAHEAFWRVGSPDVGSDDHRRPIDDNTMVVLERFRVLPVQDSSSILERTTRSGGDQASY